MSLVDIAFLQFVRLKQSDTRMVSSQEYKREGRRGFLYFPVQTCFEEY